MVASARSEGRVRRGLHVVMEGGNAVRMNEGRIGVEQRLAVAVACSEGVRCMRQVRGTRL